MSDVAPFNPERLIRILRKHKVDFVLIGALAARLHGFPRLTADADISPAKTPANLARLASALRELKARMYTEPVPEGLAFDCSARTLARARMWNLVTDSGRLDLAFEPAGTGGYADLERTAERFEAFGVRFLAASIADIIRSKEATGRARDREDVALLRAMQRQFNSP